MENQSRHHQAMPPPPALRQAPPLAEHDNQQTPPYPPLLNRTASSRTPQIPHNNNNENNNGNNNNTNANNNNNNENATMPIDADVNINVPHINDAAPAPGANVVPYNNNNRNNDAHHHHAAVLPNIGDNKPNNSSASANANANANAALALLPYPISDEQLQALAIRHQIALGLVQIIGQCRLALRYTIVGWTGTLPKDQIPTSIASAPSITNLDKRIDALDRAINAFLPPAAAATAVAMNSATLARVDWARATLLTAAEPGVKATTRCIAPMLDSVERDARAARILPPADHDGWAWSWSHGDWFRWNAAARKWVASANGVEIDNLI